MDELAPPRLTPVKQALVKIDALRREIADLRRGLDEPIAVVGIGCRLPGGADSPELLWKMLAAGTDAVGEVPPDRWTDALHDPRPGRPDTSYSRHGAFIAGVDLFDAAFFGISGREARRIDPQQRLLLECSWRAIEDAGLTRAAVKGSRTGVFVGLSLDDYARISENTPDAERSPAQTSLGTARPMAAGRIAYLFDLHGPTVQLDTACSSSLVTAHLACQSLRSRECDIALAGGASLMLSPEMTVGLCELQALSPEGHCKTFDASADGYVRGEGAGIVALMRLSDALAQRRPVRALIRGSAVNHDGRSNGLTAPNGNAQRDVIRAALQRAGVAPAEVDYVEAHGTGTLLGDPIELRALHDVYCSGTARALPLHVGSIKTNIGHLEAAASVAALIKVVCSLQQGALPRHLHFETPTPHVDWAGNGIRVVDRHMPWPEGRPGKRLAGISAFGMSGTNAHLVVEGWAGDRGDEADVVPQDTADPPLPARAPQIFPFSAHTAPALRRALHDAGEHLRAHPGIAPADFAHALRSARDSHRHRVALVAGSNEQLLEAIAGAAQKAAAASADGNGRLAFLFTGQGAQYGGMARQLYRSFTTFRDVIDECDRHFEALDPVSLIDVLWGERQDLIDDTRYTQPAMFAVESALARLWTSWGIVPDLVMGHSVGEYAAACLAGVFSLEDGFRLVVARGQLMESLTPPGRMSAVFASAADLAPYLAGAADRLALAGDNGPRSVVVSGEPGALDALLQRLHADGFQTRPLAVSRAFHSPLMEPMLERFRTVAESVRYAAPRLRVVSNVSGAIESTRLCDPAYWVEHVRGTVAFREGVATLVGEGVSTFVEVGPGKVLSALAQSCCANAVRSLHSFDPRRDERETLLATLAALYEQGNAVDWAAFDAASSSPRRAARPVALPAYPLEPESYWVGTRRPADRLRPLGSAALAPAGESGLLGRELALPASRERRFEGRLSLATSSGLGGHRVHGRCVLPAAAFVEIALDAAARCAGAGSALEAADLAFDQVLSIEDTQALRLGTVVGADRLDIHSRPDGDETPGRPWTRHAGARLVAPADEIKSPDLAQFQAECTESLSPSMLYERLGDAGLRYEGAFRSIREVARAAGSALGRIEIDAAAARCGGRVTDPALLDNCFQLVAAALWEMPSETVWLPVALQHVRWRVPVATRGVRCAVRVNSTTPLVDADLWLFDDDGNCLATLRGLQLAAVDSRRLEASDTALHTIEWKALPGAAGTAPPQADYLVVGDGGALEAEIEAELRAADLPHSAVRAPFEGDTGDDTLGTAWRNLLAGFVRRSTTAPQRVVIYRWPEQVSASTGDAEQVVEAHRRFASFWRALLATDGAGRALTLCLLTRQGQSLPQRDDTLLPMQAAAWGLGRSLMHESGDTRVLLLDTDDAGGAKALLQAIGAGLQSDESQFAVRGEAVHVPRLALHRSTQAAPAVLRGTQLVTGGRGAIGTLLVEWLIARGAPKVVAASRQLPAGAEQQRLAALAAERGVRLEFAAADIADGAAVRQLVATIEADPALPLRGVFHAAGTLEDGLLAMQPVASVHRVMAPKVAGTLNLHLATRSLALDHFVSFSSIVSCIGSPGQCAYGAANAYLDAIGRQRNAEGLPAQVINWGLWGGHGMAEQLDAQQLRRIESFGMKAIDPAAAMQALESLLGERAGQTLVWRVDVDTLLARAASRSLRPLLADLAHAHPSPAQRSADHAGLAERLRALPRAERSSVLTAHLVDALAATLQVARERVGAQAPLIELGLDSLMAAEFRNTIRNELDVDISFGRLLEGATLADIATTVVERLDGPAAAAAPAPQRETRRIDAVSVEATFDAEMETGQL